MLLEYHISGALGSLTEYFQEHFFPFTAPTQENLQDLVRAQFALGGMHSVRFLHRRFLEQVAGKSLNMYYPTLGEAPVSPEGFAKVTASYALAVIPDQLKDLPVFLIADDTLVPKTGTHFDCVGTLFDHCRRQGEEYINGHDWAALSMSIPYSMMAYYAM